METIAPIAVIAGKRFGPDSLTVRVEFQQASGERIVGVLPFELRLLAAPDHVVHASWQATDAAGLFSKSFPWPENSTNRRWSVVVRSQLDWAGSERLGFLIIETDGQFPDRESVPTVLFRSTQGCG